MHWTVQFAPLLPLPWLVAAAVLALLALALLAWRRPRGAWLRAFCFALLLAALANPSLTEIERDTLPGIAIVIVDDSASQKLSGRREIVENVRAELAERLARFKELEVRWARVDSSDQAGGTAAFAALNRALADVPPERVSGVFLVTDGQIHDVPENAGALGFDAPVHALLTARENERDRVVKVLQAPRFGLVGEYQTVTFRIDDLGTRENGGQAVRIIIRNDGEFVAGPAVQPGQPVAIPVRIAHGGQNIIEIEAEPLEGELSAANNRAVVSMTGIRDKLRVLLVSGEPHAGERTWRNLLKSDAAVDLVHFTILRPPEKQDGTPINQLSLIAFPTRELFSVKIDEFDLIILDRYRRRGVLPMIYFDNIARFVRNGGALLVASGPDFASTASIYHSPLSPVLPATPTGSLIERPFKPVISERGARHPVTRGLPGSRSDPPRWGRWFRAVEAVPERGEVVLNTSENQPLLLLSREEEGRVALLLSDHAWLWSRGFEGGGPQIALLRRLSHWLMKEPDLEEERLSAEGEAGKLAIERQTMKESAAPIRVTTPSGEEITVELAEAEPGLWRAEIAAEEFGLYNLNDGELTALAHVGPLNPKEVAELIASAEKLAPVLEATGGGAARLEGASAASSLPRLTMMTGARNWAGSGWMALKKPDAYLVRGVRSTALIAGIAGLVLLLAALAFTWYREGR
jgi:hypothetical protein